MNPVHGKIQVFIGLVLVLFVVVNNAFNLPVQRMKILDFDLADGKHWLARHELIKHLRNVESARETLKLSSPKLLQSFRWKTCDHALSLVNITDLGVSPDPLHFPGNVYLHFAGTLKETVDAPLQMKVILKKEITAAFWLEVPCIDGLGSCTYDDLCETLQGSVCPNPFVKYNIPCKCPFQKGSYKMLKSAFPANVNDIPVGNYYLEANTSYGTKHVSCLEIHFSIRQ